ncbi:Mak10-domain-containing protein [Aulographum hederae CBS 113979]|uniref:Mak10-domain-containing protein n=1 Tax=Aulographum hederae CBS 113979 TaxID=1176131 RepID=A0A6G1HCD3_9PEZI|nr:Mak10-domain-containing protein [Aulographum hederae CBS 113979]
MDEDDTLAQAASSVHMTDANGIAFLVSEGELREINRQSPVQSPPQDAGVQAQSEVEWKMVGHKKVYELTEKFRRNAAALPVGVLVKDEDFTLFESVGALEIMDPKMDSGFLSPGETFQDEYDILRDLLPEEVVGIIDQLLCYEMAWHEGYPLSQTLFLSHYIDRLTWPEPKWLSDAQFSRDGASLSAHPLVHTVLRSYCLGLIKCCDFIVKRIGTSHYYEEEDFSTHTYNRPLLESHPKEQIIGLLNNAETWLESPEAKNSIREEILNALKARISFRTALLIAMSLDSDPKILVDSWTVVTMILPSIQSSHLLRQDVPDAFSPKIQRRLTSTVPPRPVIVLEFDQALKLMGALCTDSKEAVRINEVGTQSVERLKAFLWAFSSRKPEPLPYPRSLVSDLLFKAINPTVGALFLRDLGELTLPEDMALDPINWTFEAPRSARAPPDPRFEIAQTLDSFTHKSLHDIGGYIDFFRALCSNRCRLRRNLTHVLIALDETQKDAENVDPYLKTLNPEMINYPLSTWTYHQKLRVMEWIVQLGFELDIFLPDEVAGMYWWLSTISVTRATLLEHILPFLKKRLHRLEGREPSIRGDSEEVKRAVNFVESLSLEARGTYHLSDALSALYIHLSYLHLIPTPKNPQTIPALRHELRFKPFLTIEPPSPPSFGDLDARIHPLGPYDSPSQDVFTMGELLCKNTAESLKQAKDKFATYKRMGAAAAKWDAVEEAWKKGTGSVAASCVATGIAIEELRRVCKMRKGKEEVRVELPKPEERYHAWWIVPKILENVK